MAQVVKKIRVTAVLILDPTPNYERHINVGSALQQLHLRLQHCVPPSDPSRSISGMILDREYQPMLHWKLEQDDEKGSML